MEHISGTGLSPAPARLSRRVPLCALLPCRLPFNPARASTPAVWALPLSLAATRGDTVVFLSSAYLDVSVRRVGLRSRRMPRPRAAGFPIRASADPWLLAPPRGLSRPAAPFVAPGSLGIPRAPFVARSPPGIASRGLSYSFSVVFHMLSLRRLPRPPSCGGTRGASLCVVVSSAARAFQRATASRFLLSPILSMNRLRGPPRGCRPLQWRMWGSNPRPPACKAGALAS